MNLFDASAILAFLLDETGADIVETALLPGGSAISSANWSEVAATSLGHGRDWRASRAPLLGYDITVEPVTLDDAEEAARLWLRAPHLSLGNRLCLATGERLEATVFTADTAWSAFDRVRQIR